MIRLVSFCHMPGYYSVTIFSHTHISDVQCIWDIIGHDMSPTGWKNYINEIDCDMRLTVEYFSLVNFFRVYSILF